MKTFLLLLMAINAVSARANTPKAFDTSNSTIISLQGNGYIYPTGERNRGGNIGDKGLAYWKNEQTFARVFFLPAQVGEIYVALKLKSATGNSRLKISLDDEAKSYETEISQGQEVTCLLYTSPSPRDS